MMHKNNFDFLRFSFAFIVVIFHILVLYPPFSSYSNYNYVYVSITGFFVISGYLIANSYVKTNNVKKYFIKRARRLLPAYISVIITGAILLSFFSTLPFAQYFTSSALYKYLISNLLFLNFLQPCLPGVFANNNICAVDGALWTIKIEVCFYLLLPLIILLIKKCKKRWWIFAALYFTSSIYVLGVKTLARIYPLHAALFDVIEHQLPGYINYFTAGIIMFYFFDIFKRYKNIIAAIALVVFITELYFNLEILRPIALACLIMYVAYGFKFLNNWGKYGDFSYGIYIYHFPLIQLAISLGFFAGKSFFIILVSITAAVLFIAYLSWHLMEKRFLHKKTGNPGI